MACKDVVVRVAGEGGEGVISVADILTRTAVNSGFDVFTFRSYPAEIRGGLAMMQVRISTSQIHSIGRGADILMAFNQEAIDGWGKPDDLTRDAVVLYDPRHATIPDNYPRRTVEVALHDTAMSATGARINKNIVALAALVKAVDLPAKAAKDLVIKKFTRKGQEVVDKTLAAFEAGSSLLADPALEPMRLEHAAVESAGNRIVISGNQALSMGALTAGVRFVAGYPITPATQVLEFMMRFLPGLGGKVVQAEDEISAIAHCLGASFGGARAMTATSGPGLCLMSELIGMASMSELPVVLCDVMRSGPGTGMPTKTEQGDLMYAMHGSAGEAPRIVIAPTSIEDCFYATIEAFNYAERFQMPVILLSDQSMAYRTKTVDIPDVQRIPPATRDTPTGEELADYHRYRDTESGVSPMSVPGTDNGMYVMSGLEHDERGKANYTPAIRAQMMAKRYRKLDTLAAELEANGNGCYEAVDGARVGVVGWGSTDGPIREGVARASADGAMFAHMHPRVLMPLATEKVERFLKPLDRIIVFEENFTGQFAQHLRANVNMGNTEVIEVNQCSGLPFTSDDVFAELGKYV